MTYRSLIHRSSSEENVKSVKRAASEGTQVVGFHSNWVQLLAIQPTSLTWIQTRATQCPIAIWKWFVHAAKVNKSFFYGSTCTGVIMKCRMIHFTLDNVALQTLNYNWIEFLWASISRCLHRTFGNMSYEWIIGSYSGPGLLPNTPF